MGGKPVDVKKVATTIGMSEGRSGISSNVSESTGGGSSMVKAPAMSGGDRQTSPRNVHEEFAEIQRVDMEKSDRGSSSNQAEAQAESSIMRDKMSTSNIAGDGHVRMKGAGSQTATGGAESDNILDISSDDDEVLEVQPVSQIETQLRQIRLESEKTEKQVDEKNSKNCLAGLHQTAE